MTAATDVLARYGVTITDEELARELGKALGALPGAAAADSLSETETAYLAAHAGQDASRLLAAFDPEEAHRGQALAKADATARLLRGLLTREATAELLGIDASGVSRRIGDGRLWALARDGHRIPAWQIHAGRLLPGLTSVVRALPDAVNPLTVEGLMTTPQDDLDGLTPLEYLVAGGQPERVAELVADLDRW